jgi:hypothetical protein
MFDLSIIFDLKKLVCCSGTVDDSLEMLMSSLEQDSSNDTKVSEILLKLVNGKFKAGLIYKDTQLVKQIGNYKVNKLMYFYTISVPIDTSWNLILMSSKQIKLNNQQFKLIELLGKYLEAVD